MRYLTGIDDGAADQSVVDGDAGPAGWPTMAAVIVPETVLVTLPVTVMPLTSMQLMAAELLTED